MRQKGKTNRKTPIKLISENNNVEPFGGSTLQVPCVPSGSRLLTPDSPLVTPVYLDCDSLKDWFHQTKRDLPWRQSPTPYAVWISEVMLQQTQVAVVVPYFLRWMERFPTIQSLAEAPLDTVLKLWEGLGYYSRARNLHEGAKTIVMNFGGILPSDEASLSTIKGLGPYTRGAILSFAFHQKKAAVDGNVIRVLSRYFQIEEDISKPSTVKLIWKLAESLLPQKESWIVNEALIELGATFCQRKPQCSQCPLKRTCKAHINGVADQLPVKTRRIQTEYLYRAVAVIRHEERYLVRRGKKGEIMHDLHEFPFFETSNEGLTVPELKKLIKSKFKLDVQCVEELAEVAHSFTRYQVRLAPVLFSCSKRTSVADFDWITLAELKKLAFSSGHRRILHSCSATH